MERLAQSTGYPITTGQGAQRSPAFPAADPSSPIKGRVCVAPHSTCDLHPWAGVQLALAVLWGLIAMGDRQGLRGQSLSGHPSPRQDSCDQELSPYSSSGCLPPTAPIPPHSTPPQQHVLVVPASAFLMASQQDGRTWLPENTLVPILM